MHTTSLPVKLRICRFNFRRACNIPKLSFLLYAYFYRGKMYADLPSITNVALLVNSVFETAAPVYAFLAPDSIIWSSLFGTDPLCIVSSLMETCVAQYSILLIYSPLIPTSLSFATSISVSVFSFFPTLRWSFRDYRCAILVCCCIFFGYCVPCQSHIGPKSSHPTHRCPLSAFYAGISHHFICSLLDKCVERWFYVSCWVKIR